MPPLGATPPSANPPSEVRSGKVGWIVIGLAIAIGLVMGVVVYFRASSGSMQITEWRKSYATRGQTMTATACVSDVIHFFEEDCTAPARMCLDAVSYGVADCLAARDRAEECKPIGNSMKPAQWAYERCKEVGVDKTSPKAIKESCTTAWRALDTFCKSGQKGVVL
ncbi:MAG: hypothetical protein U1F43_24505 [Myxococcota bacterium]